MLKRKISAEFKENKKIVSLDGVIEDIARLDLERQTDQRAGSQQIVY